MNINILRNTLAASAVLLMGNALQAAEPNMGNNHFEGVSLQAGINFGNTGKNEYSLDGSKHDNKSENASIFTDPNKTKAYEGNKNVSLKYDTLSYERDNKLQIGGELGVTYRQPMGEGLLVGGYVGVAYNFDTEHSYNFKAKGTGGGEQSAEEALKAHLGLTGDTKTVNFNEANRTFSATAATLTKDVALKVQVSPNDTLTHTNGMTLTLPTGKQLNSTTAVSKKGTSAGAAVDFECTGYVDGLTKADFGGNKDVSVSKTSFKASRDITVKVKNDFSFIVAGTVGMPVMDRLLLEGMAGLKIDTYKFNATVSGVTISDLGRETTNRNMKDVTFVDSKGITFAVKAKTGADASAEINATENGAIKTDANHAGTGLSIIPTLHGDKIKSANFENVTGTQSWNKADELYAANAAESQKTEEKSKMCYKGYVGLRAIFNVKDNLDVGVKGYVAFPLKSEYELELSKKDGGSALVTAKFKPKMQFGGGLFVSYSF